MTRGSRMRLEGASGATAGGMPSWASWRPGVGGGGGGVGVVGGGRVGGLEGGGRSVGGGGDALLHLAHLRLQRRLVADGGRHAAEKRRHFRARLGEAEDVVDEEQDVFALVV